LELLLFLSALLSGLTGFVTGERSAAPSGVEQGAVQIAAAADEIVEAVAARRAVVATGSFAEETEQPFRAADAAAIDPLTVSERRLE
jgi:hypothetical protein